MFVPIAFILGGICGWIVQVNSANQVLACFAFLIALFAFSYPAYYFASEERKTFAAKLPTWEKAVQKWASLYYCARDDGAFIPGQSRFIPIGEMNSFLYEQAEREAERKKQEETQWFQADDLTKQIEELLRKGKKIAAVKLYRESTGGKIGLKEAKDFVDGIEKQMKGR